MPLFPPFNIVHPTALIEAIEHLKKLTSGVGITKTSRWKTLLEKVKKQEILSQQEKIQLINNLSSIPLDLQSIFKNLFIDNLTLVTLENASRYQTETLDSPETLKLLADPKIIEKFNESYLPSGVFDAIEILGNEEKEKKWVRLKLEDKIKIKSFLTTLSPLEPQQNYSRGQKRIAILILSDPNISTIIAEQLDEIINLIVEVKTAKNNELYYIDEILRHYFTYDSAWTTKVLDKNYFLAKLVQHIAHFESVESKIPQFKHIKLLRQKINEINDALKLLNEAEPDRGEFWRNHISRCQFVEPKKLLGNSVATAFGFSTFVIVDYGPSGSAALLYERKQFEDKVRNTHRWRDIEFVIPMPPYTNDGRLIHDSGWQDKFTKLINKLLKDGVPTK